MNIIMNHYNIKLCCPSVANGDGADRALLEQHTRVRLREHAEDVKMAEVGSFRDAQSTEKSVFYGFLSLVSVYGKKRFMDESTDFFLLGSATTSPPLRFRDTRYSTDKKIIYGRICGFFLTRFGYYPTPLHFRDSRYFARGE